MTNKIYLPVRLALGKPVVRVNGKCYKRVGPAKEEPNLFQDLSAFRDCLSCEDSESSSSSGSISISFSDSSGSSGPCCVCSADVYETAAINNGEWTDFPNQICFDEIVTITFREMDYVVDPFDTTYLDIWACGEINLIDSGGGIPEEDDGLSYQHIIFPGFFYPGNGHIFTVKFRIVRPPPPFNSCVCAEMLLWRSGDLSGMRLYYDPRPCEPVGRCCVGPNCSILTEEEHNAAGGQWSGAGTDCSGPLCPAE